MLIYQKVQIHKLSSISSSKSLISRCSLAIKPKEKKSRNPNKISFNKVLISFSFIPFRFTVVLRHLVMEHLEAFVSFSVFADFSPPVAAVVAVCSNCCRVRVCARVFVRVLSNAPFTSSYFVLLAASLRLTVDFTLNQNKSKH